MLISIVPTAALLVASATFVAYDYVAVRNEQIRTRSAARRIASARGAAAACRVGDDRRAARLMLRRPAIAIAT